MITKNRQKPIKSSKQPFSRKDQQINSFHLKINKSKVFLKGSTIKKKIKK